MKRQRGREDAAAIGSMEPPCGSREKRKRVRSATLSIGKQTRRIGLEKLFMRLFELACSSLAGFLLLPKVKAKVYQAHRVNNIRHIWQFFLFKKNILLCNPFFCSF